MTEVKVQNGIRREFYELFINGEKVESSDGGTNDIINPATGEVIAKVAMATGEDAERAVMAARDAFENSKWKIYPASKRAKILNRIASIMRERFKELVELEVLNSGKSINAATGQINQAVEDFEYYAGAVCNHGGQTNDVPGQFHNYTEKEPVGVCAQIVPWNYPLMMAAWKVAPALAAGCTVVLKPASLTPLTALILGEICQEAGVPDGVINILPGSGSRVGDYLVEHPEVDKVAFTGSTDTGKDIMSKASRTLKRLTLELGGKSPALIFGDAELENAVASSVYGIYNNTGQSCDARSRIYVEDRIYDKFVEQFVEKTKQMKMGDPMSKETHMGSLIDKSQLESVEAYIETARQEGATIAYGGNRLSIEGYEGGFWLEPTIITDVTEDMTVVRDEIFGPVVVISRFSDEKEAVSLANNTIYGLASSIYTEDTRKAKRVADKIRAGIVMINCPFSAFPGTPFGGYKQSGFGRELSAETLDLYSETKSIMSYFGRKPINPFML
ncbi:aldehyde dehydrogenase family protein [Salinicoccus carnicancri]|uniref:aldehyde dehydrogenase family protein n=1 Tax=Salinicoccus carnicancri TaxID=558170 RepID=UPI0002E20CDB|nr:aldehyde dehydrogenase family protein [Salinicoccus carnicancri]